MKAKAESTACSKGSCFDSLVCCARVRGADFRCLLMTVGRLGSSVDLVDLSSTEIAFKCS